MAAPPLIRALRPLARLAGAMAAVLLGLVTAFLLSAWIGSAMARNPGWREPADGITIMVGDNGVHTELVLPLVNTIKDWRSDFPATDVSPLAEPATHVAISWGQREVFLNTPTWADLRPRTALHAITGGAALLHVSHYVRPAPGPRNRLLRLRPSEYARLVREVERAVVPRARRVPHPGYFAWDVFYDAPGRYDWRNTCNQWTSDTLAAAGVRIGRWTPLAGGVMKWIPQPAGGLAPG